LHVLRHGPPGEAVRVCECLDHLEVVVGIARLARSDFQGLQQRIAGIEVVVDVSQAVKLR